MALDIKQTEDYITQNISGLTAMDVTVEYPDKKEALYLEGEKDYFFFINQDGSYQFTDGQKRLKLDSHEDPENPLSEEDFLAQMVKVIVSEE